MKAKNLVRTGSVLLVLGLGVFLSACSSKEPKEMVRLTNNPESYNGKAMLGFPATPESQVTLMNAFEQPYNKWAFRNAGIFPSLMVPRGGPVLEIPRGIDSDVINHPLPGSNGSVLDAFVNDHTDGFIVIKDGVIRYEQYFGDFTEKNLHIWASSTKSMVGLLAGILVEDGVLDLDEMVENYLPEMKGSAFEGLTLQQVLNMVSALDYSEDYVDLRPGTVHYEYFRRIGFMPAFDLMALDPKQDDTPKGNLGFLPNIKRDTNKTPGEVYEYHSPNVDVIGLIISRVTNQSLEEVISEHIWQKLGAEHDAQIMADGAFNPIATGGMMSTLRDFARFGYVVLNDGKLNKDQVIPKDFIEDTFSVSADELAAGQKSIYRSNEENAAYDKHFRAYKNFWWVHDKDQQIMTARGVYGQGLYIDKTNNVVIAHFGSADSASNAMRETSKVKMDALKYIAENIK